MINLKSHSFYEPSTGSHDVPALERWKQEDQVVRASFGYIVSFRISWAVLDPVSEQADTWF